MEKKTPKILIVEDEPDLLYMYKEKLGSEGYDVFVAQDGEKGYDLAKEIRPDIILLDLLMPKVDGFSMLKKLKKNNFTDTMAIIIFSNLSQKEEIEKGFKLGAKDFIIKTSITPQELSEKVKEYLKTHYQR